MKVICPVCNKKSNLHVDTVEEANGSTFDCAWCNALLIMKGGKVLDFHKQLHEQEPSWPADGKNTGFVEIREGA